MFVFFLHYLLGPHRWKTLSCLQMQPFRGVPRKTCLKTSSKFTAEYPCRSLISIKLRWNFIEIALRNECSPVNLLHVFRTPLYKNTYGRAAFITLSYIVILSFSWIRVVLIQLCVVAILTLSWRRPLS